MATTYPITPAQKQFLESFRCERLTADPKNAKLIQNFFNKKGQGLVMQLRYNAWREDTAGSTAYYVIKNAKGQIVLFFSLKCGVLFNPNSIKENVDIFSGDDYGKMWDAILNEEEAAMPELQGLRETDPIEVFQAATDEALDHLILLANTLGHARVFMLQRILDNHLDTFKGTKIDKKMETNRNIVRVPQSFSAIELVEFCSNELTAGCWNTAFMGGRSMGLTLFWAFIVPKMLEINSLIGSEYVFLFAADHGLSLRQQGIGKLIQFYQSMHFDFEPELGTAKPVYDYRCQFMCQRLKGTEKSAGMDDHLKEFFDNFNENPAARDYV